MGIISEVEELLKQKFGDSEISVKTWDVHEEEAGHFAVSVASSLFRGKTLIQQHKMIYEAIGKERIGALIHALHIKTEVR